MANTTVVTANSIEITGLDADWYLDQDAPQFKYAGLSIETIQFRPSAANDVMVIRDSKNGLATTGSIFNVICGGATDEKLQDYDGIWAHPHIDIGDCTLDTAANCLVLITFR